MTRRTAPLLLLALAVTMPGVAAAQPQRTPGPQGQTQGPVQGLVGSQNTDAPVQIEAATLEVRDKNKTATFSGNVQVVQGDTTMKCQTLVVFYGAELGIAGAGGETPAAVPAPAVKASTGMPNGAQNIRRIEAHGGVTVVTKDQNASGDLAVYDLKAKTITLTGNVTVSQGQNIIRGERVVVDTATGNARVESNSTGSTASAGGRVRALILPNKLQSGAGNAMTVGPGHGN